MKFSFFKFFTAILMFSLLAVGISSATGLDFVAVAAPMYGYVGYKAIAPVLNINYTLPKGALFALETEVWIQDIEEELYANNEFMMRSVNHNEFVEDKTVHVPQSGSAPNVEKNRSVVPATISQRTDTDFTYSLDEYTTDPILVKDLEDIQNSYNKRQSVLTHHTREIADQVAQETIVAWAATNASGNILRTTGATEAVLPPGATGVRKKITLNDVRKLASLFDQQDIPRSGRVLLMNPEMYEQLISDNTTLNADFTGRPSLPDGVVRQLYGFDIFVRSTVAIYDNTPEIKAVGAASAATDNFGAIAWHESAVAKAMGTTKIFADEDNPTMYGSVFSAMVLHGAKYLRADFKGIGAIVQEP